MHIATHLITIIGIFDKNIWSERELEDYIKTKIKDKIFSTFHTSLEMLKIDKTNVYVSVYISCLPSEVDKKIVLKWVKQNITEPGLKVTWFGIDEINNLVNRDTMSGVFILLD